MNGMFYVVVHNYTAQVLLATLVRGMSSFVHYCLSFLYDYKDKEGSYRIIQYYMMLT